LLWFQEAAAATAAAVIIKYTMAVTQQWRAVNVALSVPVFCESALLTQTEPLTAVLCADVCLPVLLQVMIFIGFGFLMTFLRCV
jgi:hypothetical protein